VTTPMNIVLVLSSTGRPRATNDGSVAPMLMPPTQQWADGAPWKVRGNGVVFFKPQARSRRAVHVRHWGVALLVIATLAGLVLLALMVAFAGSTFYNF